MSNRRSQWNNVIAGVFVLASIVALFAVVVTLSNLSGFAGAQTLRVLFPAELGVAGLQEGAEVTIAGLKRGGKVRKIDPQLAPDAQPQPGIIVTFTIPEEFEIRVDAKVGLVVPLVGAGTTLDVSPLGTTGDPITEEVLLEGVVAPAMILRSAGLGPEQMTQVRAIIDDIAAFSENANQVSEFLANTVESDGDAIVSSVRETVEGVNEMVSDARDRWPGWVDSFDSIMTDVKATTEEGPALVEKASNVMANLDNRLNEVGDIMETVRPDMEATFENAAAITKTFREVTLENVNAFVDRAREGLDRVVVVVENVDHALTTEIPQVSRVLANARIASDNLKLTMMEIRAEPWRLFYEPSENEARESVLYDAVRTYANAVTDLDGAVSSLKALHDRYGEDLENESEAVKKVLAQLEESVSQYEEAERIWFETITRRDLKP